MRKIIITENNVEMKINFHLTIKLQNCRFFMKQSEIKIAEKTIEKFRNCEIRNAFLVYLVR
jgi:hypothetical protein